ncbi:Transcription elongation factor family protein [Perilla frutescens var. hirtella]|uniref:Transcription elongation factor family protein n=1 Tax=Perilla frutescens var. hirtella TaxID=608512 RepID=A0AAD4IWV1_PERFH|nr:Transcription elongation factor family protein [Perilla frutescens var. hirtella]KAH6805078.1 Transcription elongation factor family protein [Perilla frutescens var. frutescens]KAH6822645.1 Transcription elongation factor family protein [Perilla frutescens var. hirtella]
MGYENDPYRDDEGEPLVDFDEDVQSEGDQPHQHLLDDDVYDRGERSPTPVYDDSSSKPRKRLIKKSSVKESGPLDFGLDDDDVGDVGGDYDRDDDVAGLVRDDYSDDGKRKRDNGEKARSLEKKRKAEKGEKKFKVRKSGGGRMKDHEADPEMKEMWDTIAGDNSEDDQEGVRTLDDDNFIDDTGVDPSDRYGSGNEHSPSRAPQAEEGEEDDEIKELFKIGKKKKKNEKSPAEMALLVENVMAELEVVAEEDAELNRQGKPAINKLKKLSLLTDVLSKKQLQQEFLDHGVLTLLKNWLEPLPDGSLPNINVRAAVLKILNDFPIDLEQFDRREQLKKSGLGKVIMFLSKSDEETTSNRKLAKELVDKWSRPIFNKSTRFEDMKNFEDERAYRRPPAKKVMSNAAGRASRDDDLDLPELSQGRKSGPSSSRQHASRPEAMSMDFVVRPQSKVDPEAVRARAKQMVQDQRRAKMNKKLQQLKAPKRKQLQATKLSVEGRGMVKYL